MAQQDKEAAAEGAGEGEREREESYLHADAPYHLGSPAMQLQPLLAALQRECAKRPTCAWRETALPSRPRTSSRRHRSMLTDAQTAGI